MRNKNKKLTLNILLFVVTGFVILLYLFLNMGTIRSEGFFFFSTIASFIWLCLVILLVIYEILEEIRRTIKLNKDDHVMEFKLLKQLIQSQSEEFDILKQVLLAEVEKKDKKK